MSRLRPTLFVLLALTAIITACGTSGSGTRDSDDRGRNPGGSGGSPADSWIHPEAVTGVTIDLFAAILPPGILLAKRTFPANAARATLSGLDFAHQRSHPSRLSGVTGRLTLQLVGSAVRFDICDRVWLRDSRYPWIFYSSQKSLDLDWVRNEPGGDEIRFIGEPGS